MLIWVAVIAAIVYFDQLAKWLIVTYLPEGGLSLIGGVLRLTYVENTGAAFGMLSQYRWVFISISSVTLVLMLVYLIKNKPKGILLPCALAFIIGGGIGNMIDRVLLGYVIDFIDFVAFPQFWVWVFNIADFFICVGAGLLTLYLIITFIGEAKAEKAAKAAKAANAADPTDAANAAETANAADAAETANAADTNKTATQFDENSGTGDRQGNTEDDKNHKNNSST